MSRTFEWFPALGGPSISWGDAIHPYLLRDARGLGSMRGQPQTTKGPFQPGTTILDSVIEDRTLEFDIQVIGDTEEDHDDALSELARAMAILPADRTEGPTVGLLRYHRDGRPTIELPAVPVDSPRETRTESAVVTIATVELLAPHPFWRSRETSSLLIAIGGGVEYPLEYPLEYTIIVGGDEIDYQGDFPAAPTVRFFGRIDSPVLTRTHEPTGLVEAIAIVGEIEEGKMIEVETAFGAKNVTLVDLTTGERESAWDTLDLDETFFFWLRRGLNVFDLTFAENFTGSVDIVWRDLVAGL